MQFGNEILINHLTGKDSAESTKGVFENLLHRGSILDFSCRKNAQIVIMHFYAPINKREAEFIVKYSCLITTAW